jgi:ABC-type thiamine transport system ATPase subunit/GNAT superfamily N-acetyltransferase
MQLEGLFAVPPAAHSELKWDVHLPIEDNDWNIGLIVGASGSGKTTVARELFGGKIISGYDWPADKSVVDGFPAGTPVKQIVELLNSVGFSDPPSWLRPFGVLSNGEQFRVTMARAMAESVGDVFVMDEFTSVVDRTVAQMGSCAIARTVRKRNQRFVAVSCHYDIVDWLQPDWMYEPGTDSFQWRELQRRPTVDLTIRRVHKDAWRIFRHHHYLDTDLHQAATCFCAFLSDGTPVAFVAALPFPHAIRPGWRLHRLVCLPDYQGAGIGVALADYVSSVLKATRKPVFRTAGHPAVVAHCAKSKLWDMRRVMGRVSAAGKTSSMRSGKTGPAAGFATNRFTAGFEYVGPAAPMKDAAGFGLKIKF